jgi:hypothetical protein
MRLAQSFGLTWHDEWASDGSRLVKEYAPNFASGLALFAASFVFSLCAVTVVLIRLPVDYFRGPEPPPFWPGVSGWLRWVARILKNVLGAVLVALGIILSVPGVPGQGMLTILIGMMLMDFPRKRNLEKRIIARPAVYRTVNRLRGYFRRPPLVLDS